VVRHVKGKKLGEDVQIRIPTKYDDLVMGRGETGNFRLLSGDTIVVP
jgi:hypothetical protein